MTAFNSARAVEARALAVLAPFLKERAHEGQFVLTSKGRLARHLQETVGDALLNTDRETIWSVEIKAELRETGNLFLETWSNRNLDSRESHSDRGSNPGWMFKLRCDMLFYYFVEADVLYVIDFFKLKRWFFGWSNGAPNFHHWREVGQSKYAQLNDTHGRLVPVDAIRKNVGFTKLNPKQIELFPEVAA